MRKISCAVFASKLGLFGWDVYNFMKFLPVRFPWNFAFKCPGKVLLSSLDISNRCDGLLTASKDLIESLLASVTMMNVGHGLDSRKVPEVVEALPAGRQDDTGTDATGVSYRPSLR